MNDYRVIADTVAADILSGCLKPGDRLPPQREFAYRRGIAASTASRVYGELLRRGLVVGEVGRGTFVRYVQTSSGAALAEPAEAPVDLEFNFSALPDQNAILAASVADLLNSKRMGGVLRPMGVRATEHARTVAAGFLGRGAWAPNAPSVLFTGNGRQAIAAAMASLAGPGERVGVEAITYPQVKAIAEQLGILLVPLAMDGQGLLPDAILRAHAATRLSGIYLQPTLHNPLGNTMDVARRQDIAAVLETTGITAIEDTIYGFLADERPLVAFAPERVILVDSLSKRLSPGLTLGFIVAPHALLDQLIAAVQSGAWAAQGFAVAVGVRWMMDGTVMRLQRAKRADASARQALARKGLKGFSVRSDPRAYHLWLDLPEAWRAEAFAAAARRHGIAVVAGEAFAVSPGHVPNAVRLALASPSRVALADALKTLRRLLVSPPTP
ncbi:PLP-dependent aminotransferase family protein [Microvirga pakistanensis]|uniref:aminotransferase-like domain-containing protein n=1 Tax=Microvirga pakistanensis TaxID=1682650 RepID=UPI001FCE4865|nr:PLP-dependent aminotransferase family protein [Microvirga pakistanensis]